MIATMVWRRLNDPTRDGKRCDIILSDETWRHIVEKHVSNQDEPWDFWLPEGLAERLRATIDSERNISDEDRDTLHQASAAIEKDARVCLDRPLMLVYRRSEKGKTPPWGVKTWELILPGGSCLIVRWQGNRGSVRTCFFDERVAYWWCPGEWWLGLAIRRIRRYCGRAKQLNLPKRSEVYKLEDKSTGATAMHARVTFVTPVSWGFDTNDPGAAWKGSLDGWRRMDPAVAQAYPTLRPRVRYEVKNVSS